MSSYYIGSDLNRTYYISHHGIKGQKWGIRRFQNEDGSLTPAGRQRVKSYSWIQDKLGYDERDRMNYARGTADFQGANAKAAQQHAASKRSKAIVARQHANIEKQNHEYAMQNYNSARFYDSYVTAEEEAKKAEEEAEKAKQDFALAYEVAETAKAEHQEFIRQYNRTPLGMIDSAKSAISKGVSFVKGLFKRKK